MQPGQRLVIFIIALFSWPYISRIIADGAVDPGEGVRRGGAVAGRQGTCGSCLARSCRTSSPNIIYTTLLIPANILFEAALSFLGLGLPPSTPSWGQMLSDASGIFDVAWWFMVFPGLFLVSTVLAFNLLGDGLRDALDPRTGR